MLKNVTMIQKEGCVRRTRRVFVLGASPENAPPLTKRVKATPATTVVPPSSAMTPRQENHNISPSASSGAATKARLGATW